MGAGSGSIDPRVVAPNKSYLATHFGNMSGMQIRSLSAHEVVFIWGMKQRINRKKNIGIRILMIYSTSYPFFLEIH